MGGLREGLSRALVLLRHPVAVEKKRLLAERWAELDPRWRLPGQGLGRQATGCGATIGIQPRCDFACTGCYLTAGANSVPRVPLEEAFDQLRRLRAHLGPKGNVQITDGEVTLLPERELLALVARACELELLPMVMTHGDTFRCRPGLLERLMRAGLSEVAVHVDSTQRGRRGCERARSEEDLEPLRDEIADLVRSAARATGRRLRCAMTMTVTGENLAGVPHVLRWALANRDVFGLVSLQPLARVGRTAETLSGVSVEALWERVEAALAPFGFTTPAAGEGLLFGHPACTRVVLSAVVDHDDGPLILPLVRPGRREDLEVVEDYFRLGLGGAVFRGDSRLESLCRGIGLLHRAPGWWLGRCRRWALGRLREAGLSPWRLLWGSVRRRVRAGGFVVTSHHFMSAEELETPGGRERLEACLFRVPVDGGMVPMCRVNAGGVRESFYRRRAHPPAGSGRTGNAG